MGIPLFMFLLLWRNKQHLHDEKSPRHHLVKSALGGMYTQYEPSYWWFEIFLLLNKTIMCGGLVMAAPGTPLQVLIAILVMLCHLLVTLRLAPYESDGEDVSAFLSALTLTLTTIGGMVLMMDSPDVATGETSFNSAVLAHLLVGISALCIVSQIGITVFIDCGVWERWSNRKNNNAGGAKGAATMSSSNSNKKQSSSKVVPVSKSNEIDAAATATWT